MSVEWSETILPEGWSLEVVKEIDSTNAELKRREGVEEGLVLVAESQTGGVGRRGSPWSSVEGESLAFTVALRPSVARSHWPRLALATGLAVAEAVVGLGIEAEVKWPNDVLVRGKKLCGILVEATDDLAIIGIGLNVGQPSFSDDLAGHATSLRIEGRADVSLTEALGMVLGELRLWSGRVGSEFPELVGRLRERCALTGKIVSLRASDGMHQGRVIQIADRGELLLETADGPKAFVQADEVRLIADT